MDRFNEIIADAEEHCATCSNVVSIRKEASTRPARRPVTRVWDEAEVAKRALDLYALERTAKCAFNSAIIMAEQFKEFNGLERVDHKDPAFRTYTAKEWDAYLVAKDEVKKAQARLKTACHNCLHGAPKREKYVDPRSPADRKRQSDLWDAIIAGTVSMRDALAMRYDNGDPILKDREAFLDIARDESEIPF
ncbi:hypothetical protein GNZ12_24070 [Paraburkholderia sp. 1N]|uniref:Uncharacterized protein n=1 Tax=Paraburkholderia solitsugae TaxID=2675748 RepID=A0ABX2BTY1_9BURK|nr:hypothetical protein [Paraburkholderia solitsugae]NPT44330.1 hypothetical protein [Paraburkholderia solitsugae]